LRTGWGREGEWATSKRNWAAVATLLTFWPPGPGERTKWNSSSSRSKARVGVIWIRSTPAGFPKGAQGARAFPDCSSNLARPSGGRLSSGLQSRPDPAALARSRAQDSHSARTELLGSACQQPGSPGWPQQVDPVETRIPRLRTKSLSLVRKGKGCLQFVIQLRKDGWDPRESLCGGRGEDMFFLVSGGTAALIGLLRPAYGLGRPAVRA